MGIIDSYKKNGLKYFTPKRAWLFLRFLWRRVVGVRMPIKDISTYSEIVTYRSISCQECIVAGSCQHCGCDMNGLVTDMSSECSEGRWGSVDSKNLKEDWENQKEESRVYLMINNY